MGFGPTGLPASEILVKGGPYPDLNVDELRANIQSRHSSSSAVQIKVLAPDAVVIQRLPVPVGQSLHQWKTDLMGLYEENATTPFIRRDDWKKIRARKELKRDKLYVGDTCISADGNVIGSPFYRYGDSSLDDYHPVVPWDDIPVAGRIRDWIHREIGGHQ
jgi:hypothetical protein